jgi:Na+/H+-dicarboxylate symporter
MAGIARAGIASTCDESFAQQLGIIGVLLLTSKGAAGVTGSGFIVLAATLSSVGHIPVASIALILGVDRFMSEARALTNLIGNGVATVIALGRRTRHEKNAVPPEPGDGSRGGYSGAGPRRGRGQSRRPAQTGDVLS